MNEKHQYQQASDESPSRLVGSLAGLSPAVISFHCGHPAVAAMRRTDVSAKSDMRFQDVLVRSKAAGSSSGATKVGVAHTAVLCTEPCVLTEGKVVRGLVVHEVETSAPITRVVISFGKDSSRIAAGAGRKCSVAAEQQKCVEHATRVACSTLNFPAHAGMSRTANRAAQKANANSWAVKTVARDHRCHLGSGSGNGATEVFSNLDNSGVSLPGNEPRKRGDGSEQVNFAVKTQGHDSAYAGETRMRCQSGSSAENEKTGWRSVYFGVLQPVLRQQDIFYAKGENREVGGVVSDLLVETALRMDGVRHRAGLVRLKGGRRWAHSQIS